MTQNLKLNSLTLKKKKIKNEDLERIAKNNTFSPSPPRALSCNLLRPCQGRAEGLLARGWKQRDPEEFRNRTILAWREVFYLGLSG